MDYSRIRARARNRMRENWALSIAICLVAQLLGGVMIGSNFLPEITFRVRGEITSLKDALTALTTLSHRFGGATFSIGALGLAELILGGVIQLGYAKILLRQQDGEPFAFRDLFCEFDRFGQGFAQKFLRGLYVFLWSLLLVIPGIVAQYRYAMTPYIMAEHPELTAGEAIEASARMMDGHKGELFILHLTFIGWDILAALTFNIGHLCLNPYKNAAEAAFYRELNAKHPYFFRAAQ